MIADLIKHPIVLLGLTLSVAGNTCAQQLYERKPAMKLKSMGIVEQLEGGYSVTSAQSNNKIDHAVVHEEQRPASPQQRVDPLSSRQAFYETADPNQDEWNNLLSASSLTTAENARSAETALSFIEREKAPGENRKSAQELIKKISINLLFVLAIAVGFILIARQWYKSRFAAGVTPSAPTGQLRVSQVLRLTNGASLHVVEGFQKTCLVAIDAAGIKSVDVLTPHFAESLGQDEQIEAKPRFEEPEPIERDESSAEIDQNLIRLLVQNSRKAA